MKEIDQEVANKIHEEFAEVGDDDVLEVIEEPFDNKPQEIFQEGLAYAYLISKQEIETPKHLSRQ